MLKQKKGTEKGEKSVDEYLEHLKKYADRLIKKPLKLKESKMGFPLCPICNEEFKNKEIIIEHLIKNKKEFKELEDGESEEILKGIKEENETPYIIDIITEKDGKVTEHIREDLLINEEIIEDLVRKKKLFEEVKQKKYRKWKEEKKPKLRESFISQKVRFEVLKRDNFTCQYCGRKSPNVELEVDHIQPYSKTKDDSTENLITACKECNRGKREKEII